MDVPATALLPTTTLLPLASMLLPPWMRASMLAPQVKPAPVLVLTLNGAIGPATADYVHRGIEQARVQGAQLLVLQMDTPGGLDSAMRAISGAPRRPG